LQPAVIVGKLAQILSIWRYHDVVVDIILFALSAPRACVDPVIMIDNLR
jgi:hypothetical protein